MPLPETLAELLHDPNGGRSKNHSHPTDYSHPLATPEDEENEPNLVDSDDEEDDSDEDDEDDSNDDDYGASHTTKKPKPPKSKSLKSQKLKPEPPLHAQRPPDDPVLDPDDPSINYPRQGYGLGRTLPPEGDDLRWLVDADEEVYAHLVLRDGEGARGALGLGRVGGGDVGTGGAANGSGGTEGDLVNGKGKGRAT